MVNYLPVTKRTSYLQPVLHQGILVPFTVGEGGGGEGGKTLSPRY